MRNSLLLQTEKKSEYNTISNGLFGSQGFILYNDSFKGLVFLNRDR